MPESHFEDAQPSSSGQVLRHAPARIQAIEAMKLQALALLRFVLSFAVSFCQFLFILSNFLGSQDEDGRSATVIEGCLFCNEPRQAAVFGRPATGTIRPFRMEYSSEPQ